MGDLKMSTMKFVPLKDPKVLKPILKERHPHSCFFYNQVVTCDGFKNELCFYSLGEEINSKTWLIADYIREDYGHNICVSAPVEIVSGKKMIPPEIKECFSSTSIIDWDNGSVFVSLEKPVSAMIIDISANIKGNITCVHPCILYYMELEDVQKLSISLGPEAEVRRLNSDDDAQFITSTWKYSNDNSGIVYKKCIKANPSAGVFVDNKCVSGVAMAGNGVISSLYTLKEYRNKGYGKIVMHYTYKECAKDGCIPCSTVEVKNSRSLAFHDKLGAKPLSVVDWVDVQKLDID